MKFLSVNLLVLLALGLAAVVSSPVKKHHGRITNGDLAKQGQFPYQVGLRLFIDDSAFWCGGTLLSDRWILTAAHCTFGVDRAIVFLGATDIQNDDESGQQRVHVSRSDIFVHEEYDSETITHDIALIKMPVAVEFNEFIQPALLPKKRDDGTYDDYVDELVWASGWGRDSDASTAVSQYLRYIEVPVVTRQQCAKSFFGKITDKQICISGKEGKSTCNGDSGGPLVHKDGDKNYVIGATSFGIILGCEVGWPAVFTRVTAYLDWIQEHTGLVN